LFQDKESNIDLWRAKNEQQNKRNNPKP